MGCLKHLVVEGFILVNTLVSLHISSCLVLDSFKYVDM